MNWVGGLTSKRWVGWLVPVRNPKITFKKIVDYVIFFGTYKMTTMISTQPSRMETTKIAD